MGVVKINEFTHDLTVWVSSRFGFRPSSKYLRSNELGICSNKICKIAASAILLLVISVLFPKQAKAASCNFYTGMTVLSKDVSNWTTTCTVSGVDGVDNSNNSDASTLNTATISLKTGGSVTINNGGKIIGGSIIFSGGNIAIQAGGTLSIGSPIYVTDTDDDGWAANFTLYNATASGRRRLGLMKSLTTTDCDDTNPAVHLTGSAPTGGTITSSGGYTIHTFTSTGTFTTTTNISNADVLVVGGGGSGGNDYGGGGGGGGVLYSTGYTINSGSQTVTIGGSNQNSVFQSLTAIAGGQGGYTWQAAKSGGSGGGGSAMGNNGAGAGTAGQGYNGGSGWGGPGDYSGGSGGGGGASHIGYGGGVKTGGNGGGGIFNSITGTAVIYGGGGGGGGSSDGTPGAGGAGGGGAGIASTCPVPTSSNGTNGLGGGGGGHGSNVCGGGTGGSGVVIIRYPTSTSWCY